VLSTEQWIRVERTSIDLRMATNTYLNKNKNRSIYNAATE
jgi:hypothetical protein